MILNILTVYNEMKFMPLKRKWCDLNGLNLYVLDNYSTDGTWQWLRDNNIDSERIDTDDSFDLRILQAGILKVVNKIKPEWIIYNGADLFPITEIPLRDFLSNIKEDVVTMHTLSVCNTGENSDNPFDYNFYNSDRLVDMISRYHKDMKWSGDDVVLKNSKKMIASGVMLNFGSTKSVKEREETYKRRIKAWNNGMRKNWGSHYKPMHDISWIVNRKEAVDIRKTEYNKYYNILKQKLR